MTESASARPRIHWAKYATVVFWLAVASVLAGGVLSALLSGSAECIPRSGKIVVTISLLATYAQFRFEGWFHVRESKLREYVERVVRERGLTTSDAARMRRDAAAAASQAFETARRDLLIAALLAAGLVELVAAFGDLAFEAVRHS